MARGLALGKEKPIKHINVEFQQRSVDCASRPAS